MSGPTVEKTIHALDSLVDEVEQERHAEDGSTVVRLVTDRGEADIRVPRMGLWRSSARNAIFTRGDDAAWALLTLSQEDADTWMDLDPTQDDAQAFIADYTRASGLSSTGNLGESRASRRSSTRSRGR